MYREHQELLGVHLKVLVYDVKDLIPHYSSGVEASCLDIHKDVTIQKNVRLSDTLCDLNLFYE